MNMTIEEFRRYIPIPDRTLTGDRFQCPNCTRTYASRLDGNVNAFYYRHFIRDHLDNRLPGANIEEGANNNRRLHEDAKEQALMEDYEATRNYIANVKFFASIVLNFLSLYEVVRYAIAVHSSHGIAMTWNIVGTFVYSAIFLLTIALWLTENISKDTVVQSCCCATNALSAQNNV